MPVGLDANVEANPSQSGCRDTPRTRLKGVSRRAAAAASPRVLCGRCAPERVSCPVLAPSEVEVA